MASGAQKCFIWGQGGLHNKVTQLEHDFDSLIKRNYSFGENKTPFIYNEKPVYIYIFNPATPINLPDRDGATIISGVEEIINTDIYCLNPFNESGTIAKLWVNLPWIRRNDANTMLFYGITDDTKQFKLWNFTITGNRKFRGNIIYTKND